MSDSTRTELLAEVKKLHRNAGNKVSRLRGNGIIISGTDNDIRRDPKRVSRYNRIQLAAYKRQLETFNSRQTSFIADTYGRVLDKNKFALYAEREKAVKAKEKKQYNKIKNIKIPLIGSEDATIKPRTQTIDQRNQSILPTRPGGKDRVVNSSFKTAKRKPRNFKSEKSLDVMTDAMAKRLDPEYRKNAIAEQRRILGDMLDVVNSNVLKAKLFNLTDDQFDIMWNNTGMPDDVKEIYLIMQKALEDDWDSSDDQIAAMYNDENDLHIDRISGWLDWAGSV